MLDRILTPVILDDIGHVSPALIPFLMAVAGTENIFVPHQCGLSQYTSRIPALSNPIGLLGD